MAREPTIPLFLWVATAALAHILWGGGAEQVARVVEDGASVSRFARSVRMHVAQANRPVEIELFDESSTQGEEPPQQQPAEPPAPEPPKDVTPPPEETEPAQQAKREPKAEERAPDPQDEPKADPDKPKAEKEQKAEPKPEQPEQPMQIVNVQRRVSVKQHVEDKNQADNPNAEFLGDHANHTDKQTQARITSTDQDEATPTPGTSHMGPSSDPGDAHVSDLAQSEDSPGDRTRAFAESPNDGEDERVEQRSARQEQPQVDPSRAVFGEAQAATQGKPTGSEQSKAASKPREALDERTAREASPKLLDSSASADLVAEERSAQAAQRARAASQQRSAPKGNGGRLPQLRGGESLGLTPGGLNPNLTPLAALSAIGADQLNKERLADGERRRSKHRGSWHAIGLERWKSAIENYVATVQPGNQTSLNTAQSPFSSYLNKIHNRLHGVFAFDFLGSLDALPADHVLNRRDLKTHIEIVLSREDGRVVKMGVTRASGSTAFDVGALEAVQNASPFGAPPREIVSPDGNVYLHWEFHRDPMYACSTFFARPFILRASPTPAPLPEPSPPAQPREEGQRGTREPSPGDREPDHDHGDHDSDHAAPRKDG